MVHLQVRFIFSLANEGSGLLARFAMSLRAVQHFYNYIGIAYKRRCANNNAGRFFGRTLEPRQPVRLGASEGRRYPRFQVAFHEVQLRYNVRRSPLTQRKFEPSGTIELSVMTYVGESALICKRCGIRRSDER